MATSGSYTYSMNRDKLILSAFRGLGVFNDDSTPPPTDMSNAAEALNLMIKQWMQEGYPLWTVAQVEVPLQTNAVVYTLGPQGYIDAFRPLRVIEARLSHASGIDVPLAQLSRNEYLSLGQKTAPGTPNCFYYDPQLKVGKLYLYLASTPDLFNQVVKLTVQRPLEDMASASDEFDFPAEALNALKFGLMQELMLEYDVPTAKAQMINSRAENLRAKLFDTSQEEASTFFTPRMQ